MHSLSCLSAFAGKTFPLKAWLKAFLNNTTDLPGLHYQRDTKAYEMFPPDRRQSLYVPPRFVVLQLPDELLQRIWMMQIVGRFRHGLMVRRSAVSMIVAAADLYLYGPMPELVPTIFPPMYVLSSRPHTSILPFVWDVHDMEEID